MPSLEEPANETTVLEVIVALAALEEPPKSTKPSWITMFALPAVE
jgi:hypothetical protein